MGEGLKRAFKAAAATRATKRSPYLTAGSERVLTMIRDSEDEELVYSAPGGWWVGNEEVDGRCCLRLLRLILIHREDYGSANFERYTINEEGQRILADPKYVPAVMRPEVLRKLGRNPLTGESTR